MIRVIQRRLIIPRGDTGTFTVPALSPGQAGSVGVFTIFDPITKTRIFQKQVELEGNVFNIEFGHGDTVNLQAGDYLWDIKFYKNPIFADNKVIDGEEIDSYYAAFQTPKCEIRETGDAFMSIDGAHADIEDINLILAATQAANAAKDAATEQAGIAADKAEQAAARLAEMIAAIPTKVSELENDSGYLSEETDPTVPAWAKAQTKPTYTPQEVGALPSDTFIPSRVSDLVDDSGHYTKPANGIPASDLEETYAKPEDIPVESGTGIGSFTTKDYTTNLGTHTQEASGLGSHAEGGNTKATGSYTHAEGTSTIASGLGSHAEGNRATASGTASHAEGTNSEANGSASHAEGRSIANGTLSHAEGLQTKAGSTAQHVQGKYNVADANDIYADIVGNGTADNARSNASALDWSGNLKLAGDVYVNANSDSTGGTKLATVEDIPTNVSDLTNDAGYLTQHQDISGKANSADLAAVATSGSYEDLSNKPTIPEVPVQDVQVDGASVLSNGVANIGIAGTSLGVVKINKDYGISIQGLDNRGVLSVSKASNSTIKEGTNNFKVIVPSSQHLSTFYGLAKAAGDTTQSQSDNTVGTYTDSAKTAIQNMLGVPAASAIPTLVSQLTNDSGYLTSFTETDPTVPSWAKAAQKPTYTAAEVGAPTVQEMNTAIGNAIGNINSFDMAVVQELPTQDISTHTIYLVPKTGETNDVYDEYVYINNDWEMVGNTQVDLSNYVQKTDYATSSTAGVVKIGTPATTGIKIESNGTIKTSRPTASVIKAGTNSVMPITPDVQSASTFYGLAKAAGDTTQSQSNNAVGTYTAEAKAAIQTMLDVPSNADLILKADKTDTVLETTLSRGRKANTTVGGASIAFGVDTEASGYYSVALGLNTTASSQGAFAEGKNTVAHYIAHAEGEDSQALGSWSHAQNLDTIANGGASSASGRHTIANGADSFVIGKYNAADSYDNWPTWTANTSYEVGDRVKRNLMVQNEPTDVGYHCTVANSDATFDNAHWELDGYHMNYVEIVGNGKEYEDPETHQTVRAGSNAYALEWNGTAHYAGDVYVNANADSSGGTKVATVNDIPDTSIYATKTDTVLETTLSRGRKEQSTIGNNSFAFGTNVEANGYDSHAEGDSTKATNSTSHAEGSSTTASGLASHSEGIATVASGEASHAEGKWSIASGAYAHAEGGYNASSYPTIASGMSSHAEGVGTLAVGSASHAEGTITIANATQSHVEGFQTEATGRASHVAGKYNIVDSYSSWPEWIASTSYEVGDKVKVTTIVDNETTIIGYKCKTANSDAEFTVANWTKDEYMNYVEIIGNGENKLRSNAYALEWTGTGRYMGDVYVGCNNDSTGGTKVLCEANFATAQDIQNIINGGAGA